MENRHNPRKPQRRFDGLAIALALLAPADEPEPETESDQDEREDAVEGDDD